MLVAFSLGRRSCRPDPPLAATPNPFGRMTVSPPLMTLISRFTEVALLAIVTRKFNAVALEAEMLEMVMPLIPVEPDGRKNSTVLVAVKCVFVPVNRTDKLAGFLR